MFLYDVELDIVDAFTYLGVDFKFKCVQSNLPLTMVNLTVHRIQLQQRPENVHLMDVKYGVSTKPHMFKIFETNHVP